MPETISPSPADVRVFSEPAKKTEELFPESHPITEYEQIRGLETNLETAAFLNRLSAEELDRLSGQYQELPEYKEYLTHPLNLDRLDSLRRDFQAGLADKNVEPTAAQHLARELDDNIQSLKYSISNYYNIVMVFERTRLSSRTWMEPDEYRSSMTDLDRRRKAIHDLLIDCIKRLSKLCYRTIPDQLGFKFPPDKLFPPDLLHDVQSGETEIHRSARNRIADWAFVNERGFRIKKAIELVSQERDKKSA